MQEKWDLRVWSRIIPRAWPLAPRVADKTWLEMIRYFLFSGIKTDDMLLSQLLVMYVQRVNQSLLPGSSSFCFWLISPDVLCNRLTAVRHGMFSEPTRVGSIWNWLWGLCGDTCACAWISSSSGMISANEGRSDGVASQHLCIKFMSLGCAFSGICGRNPWYSQYDLHYLAHFKI